MLENIFIINYFKMMLIRSVKKMGRYFSTAERQPNIIQRLPEYHEAL